MKRGLLLVLTSFSLLLTACSDSNNNVAAYIVTVSADANGSISPGSTIVDKNQTIAFTITPDAGFAIDSVSGCEGSLSNRTYTTGEITEDCTVSASFVAESVFAWHESLSMFTPTLSSVTPVDAYRTRATSAQASITVGDIAYTVFFQSNGSSVQPYLLRTVGDSIAIWDEDTSTFNTNLSTGDTIGHGGSGASASGTPAIAADSVGNVYITYVHGDNTPDNHIYLNRYNATSNDVEIWDGDSGAWSTTLSDADDSEDGIDTGVSTTQAASLPSIAINSHDDVFITYVQNSDAFVTRYDSSATEIQVWDGDTSSFSTTRDSGDNTNDLIGRLTPHAFSNTTLVVAGADIYFSTVQVESNAQSDTRISLSRFNAVTDQIERWDSGNTSFSALLTDGNDDTDFIDAGGSGVLSNDDAASPVLSFDSASGHIYLVYEKEIQGAANQTHLLMSRYNGAAVQYWDDDTGSWSTTATDGDDLTDTVSAGSSNKEATNARTAHVSNGDLYIAYLLENATNNNNHVYLSRYDISDITLEHWDEDNNAWDTDKGNGDEDADAIDDNTAATIISSELDILALNNDDIYIAYNQDLQGGTNSHLKLSRYKASTETTEVWNNDTASFSATQTDADQLSELTSTNVTLAGVTPDILQLNNGYLVISYIQVRTEQALGNTSHLQLSKVRVSTTN